MSLILCYFRFRLPLFSLPSLSAILLSVFTYRAVSSKKNSIITRFTFFLFWQKKSITLITGLLCKYPTYLAAVCVCLAFDLSAVSDVLHSYIFLFLIQYSYH